MTTYVEDEERKSPFYTLYSRVHLASMKAKKSYVACHKDALDAVVKAAKEAERLRSCVSEEKAS